MIDPANNTSKIDDVFKMKTSLDYDMDKGKFEAKMSVIELQFAETKDVIGHTEFDLGLYGNRLRDNKTVKTTLDLRSDHFPGCQVLIYVNVTLLDELPTAGSNTKKENKAGSATKYGTTVEKGDPSLMASSAIDAKHDPNLNKFMQQKEQMANEIKQLEKTQTQLNQNQERLKFFIKQTEMEKSDNIADLLQKKSKALAKCKKEIEK